MMNKRAAKDDKNKKTGRLKFSNQSKTLSIPERRFGVVLEDINSKFDLVLEGYVDIGKKIDAIGNFLMSWRKELFRELRENPMFHRFLSGKKADEIDLVVKEGLQDLESGRCIKADSISEVLTRFR